jgi:two-component system, cell cycle response regulator CtrA
MEGSGMITVELLQEQNKRLRGENDELRETVRQLREATTEHVELPEWLPHLSPKERGVLSLLSGGRIVSVDRIMETLYDNREKEPPDANIARVWICKLRRKLEPYGVIFENIYGRGYQATPATRELLRVAPNETADAA